MSSVSTISSAPASSASNSTAARVHHDLFYFRSVVFEVDNVLFRVPRYGLPGGAAEFEAKFPCPPAAGGPGSSDDDPIRMDGDVTPFDFTSLLKATYPPPGQVHGSITLTLDEWLSVLKLAKNFDLPSTRTTATSKSEELLLNKTPFEKIALGKKYKEGKWLRDAYKAIGCRKESITPGEKASLDSDTYVGLLELRDRLWAHFIQTQGSATYVSSAHSAAINSFKWNVVIPDIFGEEVK